MQIKSWFVLILFLFVTPILFASSLFDPSPPWIYVAPKVYSGPYVEGYGGFASIDWRDFVSGPFSGADVSAAERLEGGLLGGVGVGYQYNEYIAIEGGWFSLPRVDANVGINRFSFLSWAGYADLKFIAPIYKKLFIYGKFGGVYRREEVLDPEGVQWLPPNSPFIPIKGGFWSPLFAFGLQYYLNWHWFMSIQYMRLPGYVLRMNIDNPTRIDAPNADVFTFSIGYKLAI